MTHICGVELGGDWISVSGYRPAGVLSQVENPPLPASPAVCLSRIATFSPDWRNSELWRLQKLGLDPVLERYSHSLKGIKPDILESPKDQPPDPS